MKYKITAIYNSKGYNLTKAVSYTKLVDSSEELSEYEAMRLIQEDVPGELIERIVIVVGDLSSLRRGDYVKLDWRSRKHTGSNIVKVVDTRGDYITVEGHVAKFSKVSGIESYKRSDYPSIISIPSRAEIRDHENDIASAKLKTELSRIFYKITDTKDIGKLTRIKKVLEKLQ